MLLLSEQAPFSSKEVGTEINLPFIGPPIKFGFWLGSCLNRPDSVNVSANQNQFYDALVLMGPTFST